MPKNLHPRTSKCVCVCVRARARCSPRLSKDLHSCTHTRIHVCVRPCELRGCRVKGGSHGHSLQKKDAARDRCSKRPLAHESVAVPPSFSLSRSLCMCVRACVRVGANARRTTSWAMTAAHRIMTGLRFTDTSASVSISHSGSSCGGVSGSGPLPPSASANERGARGCAHSPLHASEWHRLP